MAEESISASIYMHFVMAFQKNLFHKQAGENVEDRLLLSDSYSFQQTTFQRIIIETSKQGRDSHFQVICEGAHPEYKGDNHCGFNVARALSDTARLLQKQVSENPADWTWKNLHIRQYTNLPFSKTPLKFLFHREVPYAGNSNTPNVSGMKIKNNRDNIAF